MLKHRVEAHTQELIRLKQRLLALYRAVAGINAHQRAHRRVLIELGRQLKELQAGK